MGLFKKIFNKRADEEKGNEEKGNEEIKVAKDMTDTELLTAILGHSKIDEKDALNIPSVARAVQLIADIVSMTPVKLYKEKKENRKNRIRRNCKR